jgi:hypothetical protein
MHTEPLPDDRLEMDADGYDGTSAPGTRRTRPRHALRAARRDASVARHERTTLQPSDPSQTASDADEHSPHSRLTTALQELHMNHRRPHAPPLLSGSVATIAVLLGVACGDQSGPDDAIDGSDTADTVDDVETVSDTVELDADGSDTGSEDTGREDTDVAGDAEADEGGLDTGAPDVGPPPSETFRIVHVRAANSVATQLAVHACAGLANARSGGSIFVQTDDDVPQASIDGALVRDEQWLDELGLSAAGDIEADDFLRECIVDAGGCVRYSYATQHEILPSILTAASALRVPMLSDDSPVTCTEPVLDATEAFAERTTQFLATEYVYENYLSETNGLAMLNPGYDRFASDLSNPGLTEDMPVALIDLVFSRTLFVTFLINGCIDDHPEEALLTRIVNESGWPTPVGVFGYNDSWLIGGYTYEAQTRCLPSANMGAIPTRTTNLSFFDTRRAPIVEPTELPMNPAQDVVYDPQNTYVAFIIGDGDNIRYIMSTRRDWMEQRVARCADASPACPPLSWTISPHLPDLAPDILAWYYEAATSTGSDYFALPPSGYQYAYPGMMPPDVQARFADGTERVARILGTRSVVHWEWSSDWRRSIRDLLPLYAHEGGQIEGIFPVNVPYSLEAFPWWPRGKYYEVLTGADSGQSVLFRSQSWRGINDGDSFHPSPQRMADRLSDLPRGTVTWVYMTSDGGLTLENSYGALVDLLPDHVKLVSADAAARLAIEASEN